MSMKPIDQKAKWIGIAGAALVILLVVTSQSIRAQSQETHKVASNGNLTSKGSDDNDRREGGGTAEASGVELQQLKDRLLELERAMLVLKGQINTMEQTKQATSTTAVTQPPLAKTPPDKPAGTPAQAEGSGEKSTFETYGFIMVDAGYQFNQQDPNWFDVVRPTKLPAFKDQFAPNGSVYFGVRQTRFGVKSSTPTKYGDLKTQFEFELFGTGVDQGQTTFRLRHAYGELGQFGAGQYWSPFMDIDVFPNSLEYWGPNGMVFFRNVQVRWMPIKGDSRVTIALERPGASADQGIFQDRIELQGVRGQFNLPDLSAEARLGRSWGYVEIAGMLRRIKWVDTNDDQFDLSGSDIGWGLNFSSNLKFGKRDIGRFQVVFGEGIQNYMNDAPVDVGIRTNFSDPVRPIEGVALGLVGVVAFLDHTWGERFTTSVGYSLLDIENSDAQSPSAFNRGHYGLTNILFTPVPNAMVGAEFQWGRRANFLDGFSVNDYRMQFSFKYNFSKVFSF